MRVVERVGDLRGDPHRLLHAELLLAVERRAERLALDEGHHIVEEPVGGAAVEEREDVRMLQRGGGLDLDHEPVGTEDGGELGLEDLNRDAAVVLEVFR